MNSSTSGAVNLWPAQGSMVVFGLKAEVELANSRQSRTTAPVV